MATKEKMVIGVFRNRADADRAFDRLLALGYLDSEINVLMSDTTRAAYYATTAGAQAKKQQAGTMATEGMGVGGAVGTAIGAAIGAVLAIGTTVLLPPPIGIAVAGPIAAALAGGGAGAVTGGLLGALVGWGIPEQNAQAYEEALREGGVVLGLVPHSNNDASEIQELFKDLNGENVCYC